jgi:hypothetical protein
MQSNPNLKGKGFMTTKKIFAATIFLLFVSAPCVFADASSESAPKAVLLDGIHVFEPVVEGTPVSHDFILQNHGDAPLVIESIRAG